MSQNCLEIQNIYKRYHGETIDSLSGINLTIKVGDRFGILGPNGAGKTSLISILCGIIPQSAGDVLYWGERFSEQSTALKSKIGYVPQDFAFYEDITAFQNLEYFGAMYNLPKTQVHARAHELLDLLGLKAVSHKKVKAFSGGMKRRVNLAIGILHKPSILFLDEPTVGVDIQSKNAIINFLNHINQEGTTIIYTSHHLDEAQEFCNQIALIDQGKNIISGETTALLKENDAKDLKDLMLRLTGEAYRD